MTRTVAVFHLKQKITYLEKKNLSFVLVGDFDSPKAKGIRRDIEALKKAVSALELLLSKGPEVCA